MPIDEWIYVPETEPDDFWTGRISLDESSAGHWQFEAIRMTGDGANPYSTGVFESAGPVSILIDHREKGTLIWPLVNHVEPKSAHLDRTKIKGSFQALVSGACIENMDEPVFHSIFVESPAFAAWYGTKSPKAIRDEHYRTRSIELADPEKEELTIEALGNVTVTTLALYEQGADADQLKNTVRLDITFDRLRSLAEVMDLAMGLEMLFGFLVGYRPPMSTFGMRKPANEDPSKLATSRLHLGGAFFREQSIPHPLNRLNMRGRDQSSLEAVLAAYIENPERLLNNIHAIEYSRWFGASLNDQFAAVMPVFEEYVQGKFKTADEESYLSTASDFWAYVENAPSQDLIDFANKHLKVQESKAPGLPTVIKRALTELNEQGFAFDLQLAKRINNRRAQMFHRAPVVSESAVSDFHEEKLAVTAALMLLTLRDLGVRLDGIAENLGALMEHARFTQRWNELEKERADRRSRRQKDEADKKGKKNGPADTAAHEV
ncbi:hypothetical protein GOZ90_19090 [Agrobacterium vitis]|uniref:ApeA N-terminal domain-containing protein n=1 Tax=Agrobacterium vitis TaxID=373 RepID=A0A6L6VIT3_AGRVI|nr:hypothetical protein [Agrobacterium vitis]MUZ74798.1 hypothetical protein [Agrobacterium vitis]